MARTLVETYGQEAYNQLAIDNNRLHGNSYNKCTLIAWLKGHKQLLAIPKINDSKE